MAVRSLPGVFIYGGETMGKEERKIVKEQGQDALDETLYEARRVRGILRVLADIDEIRIASYGYHELLQMAYLTHDELEKAINCLDKDVIAGLLDAGATDSMINVIHHNREVST
jgi:hypothetical protein